MNSEQQSEARQQCFRNQAAKLFNVDVTFSDGYFHGTTIYQSSDHDVTRDAFSQKWNSYKNSCEQENLFIQAKNWYLELYGFPDETSLADFLRDQRVVFDAGCGIGFKAAWFAELSPETLVIAMDISESVVIAAKRYADISNLVFIQGDISQTNLHGSSVDYVSCDQVLMHTVHPERTFAELVRILKSTGQFSCYVYARKAIPRELLDDHFRLQAGTFSHQELLELSEQLTVLGKTLHELNIQINIPEIPLLGIKGGSYDLQRFIYWNFLKCFWNEDLGPETSTIINYDWYSPKHAARYSKDEFMTMINDNRLSVVHFHEEPACFSGRFKKT